MFVDRGSFTNITSYGASTVLPKVGMDIHYSNRTILHSISIRIGQPPVAWKCSIRQTSNKRTQYVDASKMFA